jgi:hypothetical protein
MNKKRDIGLVGAVVVCAVALLLNHFFKLHNEDAGGKKNDRLKAGVPGA